MDSQTLEPKGRNDSHEMDHSIITDLILIGSDLCKGGVCKIHGEEFKTLEVENEINLSQENNELPPKDVKSYTWLPVVDGHSPTQEQLDLGTSVMNDLIKAGKRIFIHCRNGHGRSPTLVAAYFIRFEGKSVVEAENLIKTKRPEIHIEETQREELNKFSERWLK